MNLRGWVTSFFIYLCVFTVFSLEAKTLSESCRLAVSTLRGLAKTDANGLQPLQVRRLRSEVTASMDEWMDDFKKLLSANGLAVVRKNLLGIPVVESSTFHIGNSAEVYGELVRHQSGFAQSHPNVRTNGVYDLFSFAQESLKEGAEFQTHDHRFFLSIPSNIDDGFVLEMRDSESKRILAVAVPDGYESKSSRIMYRAIQKLMAYRPW